MLNQSNTTPEQLYTFQTISDFVTNLHDFFVVKGKKNKSSNGLELYYRLISKVGFGDKIITRHLDVFKKFCQQNRRHINKRELPLANTLISFSDKIFIDMDFIFRTADSGTQKVVWQYLLKLGALLDPHGGARNILSTIREEEEKKEDELDDETGCDNGGNDMLMNLMNMMPAMMGAGGGAGGGNPMDMLQNLMGGFAGAGSGGNPMDMLQNMMKPEMISSLMGTLTTTLKEQNIDMPKIFNSMHDVINKLEHDITAPHSEELSVVPSVVPSAVTEQVISESEQSTIE